MNDKALMPEPNIATQQPLHEFTEQAYLNYAMYVILDRALPHIGDGLKPVQRRILYAMSELGLKASAKHKKSARTVGDVLGKFHPHGDAACYEAMVLMAQDFSYRYPLVDGQGNWGSIDNPKSFAAMRYTESRLTAYADMLLCELGQGTTDWLDNFDGTLKEPRLLPARLPNILLNGAAGIAVGMATDIPPHNLGELIDACIHLLQTPRATVLDLCAYVQAPDFPTAAEIITPPSEIVSLYEKGHGMIKLRATWEREESYIVITALPYQCAASRIMEQIAEQIAAKKLPMLEDLRDESDHATPTRLLLIPGSNKLDYDGLMSHLFATTDLEKSYRVNLNMVGLDGRPQVKDLKCILSEWLQYRTDIVRRRLQFRQQQLVDELHRLEGLLIAYLNVDAIIQIIRTEEEPKKVMMHRFQLTATQAETILELKLRRLAKLEEEKILTLQNALQKEDSELRKVLNSEQRLRTVIRKELLADRAQFADARRSPLQTRVEAQVLQDNALVSDEPITVILSQRGWIRAAKGHAVKPEALPYKDGDGFLQACIGKRNQSVVLLDSSGRTYTLAAHALPSARSFGEHVSTRLSPPDGVNMVGIMMGDEQHLFLLASDAGYGFIVAYADLVTKNKSGKMLLNISAGKALMPSIVRNVADALIAVVSNKGHLLCFAADELPVLGKGKGLKMLHITPAKWQAHEEYVVAVTALQANDTLLLMTKKRQFRLQPDALLAYRGQRAKRGKLLPRGYRQITHLLCEPQ